MRCERQEGAALILVLVGLVAMLAMAGLAIDTGHLGLNKARLQSTVDAAALAAAKVIDQTSGAEGPASEAALSVFGINAAAHPELNRVVDNGLEITLQFSNTLQPFAPGTTPAQYVRVVAREFTMWTSFTALVGMSDMKTAASAVAGPSTAIAPLTEVCNVAPMVVCGDPSKPAPFFGYDLDTLQVLKLASGNTGTNEIGPGNFHLIRLGGQPGGAEVRRNMAGSFDSCVGDGNSVDTEPGNEVGPVTQGLNTRFGMYQGGGVNQAQHPPDVVIDSPSPKLTYDPNSQQVLQGTQVVQTGAELNFNFDAYRADVLAQNYDHQPLPDGPGAFERRVLTVPIADCSGGGSGVESLPLLGFGCYFLLQPAEQHGQTNYVYGQFIDGCIGNGNPGPDPDNTFGPYRIQLYDDVRSADS